MVAHTKQRPKIISYCNYADLQAAIFELAPDEVRAAYGLPSKHGNCLNCNAPLPCGYKEFCSQKCKHEYSRIKVECATCGKLFEKQASEVVYRLNTPQINNKPVQHFFCSSQCLGKWNAEHYGFKKKWDYEQVFKLRDETGWGAPRLSKALGIPVPTISAILQKKSFLTRKLGMI